MADEPVEVQVARIQADLSAKRYAMFEKLGIAFFAILATIPPIILQQNTAGKVSEIKAEQATIRDDVRAGRNEYRQRIGMGPVEPAKE